MDKLASVVSFPIGDRGFFATIKPGSLELRLFIRSFSSSEKLIATDKSVKLDRDEWNALKGYSGDVEAVLQRFEGGQRDAFLQKTLGENGMHVTLGEYMEKMLVHLRVYQRAFSDPTKVFPTKKGVALNVTEWRSLMQCAKSVTDAIVTPDQGI